MVKCRQTLIAFATALSTQVVAVAEEPAVTRFEDRLPRQILDMSEEERESSVPMSLIGAANLAVADYGELVIRASLNTLMYNGMADLEGAKKAFQADLGAEATGELTVGQIHALTYRASRAKLTSVSFFPFSFGGQITADAASVKGTVTIIGERIAYPINHVSIVCFKSEAYCKYDQVALTIPDEGSWVQSYSVIEVAAEYYKITRWENDQIDATPYNNTACRINQLSFNFRTKEFFEIARNNVEGNCELPLGGALPKLEKPRVSQIVDGDEIVKAEFDRVYTEGRSYFSSEFRNRISGLKTGRVSDVK